MPRARKGSARRQKHKEILKEVRGHIGAASRHYRVAKEAYIRAGQHARIGRKLRKRDFRRLWITRISAACRQRGLTYSRFIHALNERGIEVNRKMLAEIAVSDPAAFDKIVTAATSEAPAAAAAAEIPAVVAEQPQTQAATVEPQAAQAGELSTTQAPQDESVEQEKSVEQAEQAEQEQEKAKKTTTKTTKKTVKKTTARKSTKKTTTKKKATTKKTTKKTTTGKTRKKSTMKTTRKKKEE